MTSKVESKLLSIQSVTEDISIASQDGLPSWVLTVRESKLFRDLPSYFYDVDIPSGTVKSSLNVLSCYKKVVAYFKENGLVLHPVKVLESKLFDQGAMFHPMKVVMDDKSELLVKKGYLIPEGAKDEVVVIASAFVSTAIVYHAKVDDSGKLQDRPREKDLKRLNWTFPDLGPFRVVVQNFTKSSSIAQAEIYRKVKATPSVAIHLMSGIISKVPDFGEIERSLDGYMKKYYTKENISVSKQYIAMVPKRGVLKVIKKSSDPCGDLWKYLMMSRQIRGEDTAGIGQLSMGYYFFDMPRSLMKHISMVYDLRALMEYYQVNHIFLDAVVPEYVKRALVANSYRVICVDEITYPKYVDKPGIYNSIGPDRNSLVVKNITCSRPDVAKGIVMYPTVDLTTIEDAVMLAKSDEIQSVRYVVCKLPLMPLLEKSRVSLFPSCQPHNGYVWVGSSKEHGTFAFDALCYRSISSNIYRNHYPINRTAYWTMDTMMNHFNYSKSIVLPKVSLGKVEKEEKLFDFEDDKIQVVSDPLVIDLSVFEAEIVDKKAFKARDLFKVLEDLRTSVGTAEDFRIFLFNQRERKDHGNTINHFLEKILAVYSWKEIYVQFTSLGVDFEEDYKSYIGKKEMHQPIKKIVPQVEVPLPISVAADEDSSSDDLGGLTLEGDYH